MKSYRCVSHTLFSLRILLIIFLAISCKKNPAIPQITATPTHGIVPLPKQLVFTGEKITLDQSFTFVPNSSFPVASAAAQTLLGNVLNTFIISPNLPASETSFQLITDKTIIDDAYQLSVTKGGIVIKAGNEAGAFWAIQSLKQYFWNSVGGLKQASFQIAGITIADQPKYSWRGFHLDVSRHFFTKAYILKIIDWLAYYKYNKFHLHLSDDQGWRVESTNFPLLNTIGSWRIFDHNDSLCMVKALSDPSFTIDPRFIRQQNGVTMYGGFYTRQDMADIIAYAQAHFIEIVPEIDMPGHLSAAINAYHQLSCTGSTGWGSEFSYPLCPCSNSVYDFAYQIWDEVSAQFPSTFVHIGADEVDQTTWHLSSDCTGFMSTNNILNTVDLQNYFVGKVENHLESKGKTAIAWDDVTDGKISSNLKIMYWRDWVPNAPVIAATNGNQIIFTRWDLFYFSGTFSVANLQKIVEFDVTQIYPANVTSKIIGFQGCMWTEQIPSEAVFEAQVFPRLQALAEVNWSSVKDYNSFTLRMAPQRSYLLAQHVNLKN